MNLPATFRIRQHLDTSVDADVAADLRATVRARIAALALDGRYRAGQTVAVGCSSRGIHRYDSIVAATCEALQARGLRPFVFPAMGSHGAATAAGQARVLADAGISEAALGVPVHSSLEVVEVGATPDGLPVLVDRAAWAADHIVVVNRIKPHTEFTHRFESGLRKMLTIGMGKEAGASVYHQAFMVSGYAAVIEAVSRVVLASGKLLFGLGIVENAEGKTATVEAVMPEDLADAEALLLERARRLCPGLPFESVDVLVVDEMGKEISGTGIDTKVIGRIGMPLISPEPLSPRVKRIVVLDLTERTRGNADGVGLADFVTERLVARIDRAALYANALAGAEPEHAKIPMALPTARAAIAAAVASVGRIGPDQLRLIWIRNTAQLAQMEVSEAYRTELRGRADLEVVRAVSRPLPFAADGSLHQARTPTHKRVAGESP